MNKHKFQIFVEDVIGSLLTVLKILLLAKPVRLATDNKMPCCVILGNGPSLTDFLSDHSAFLEGKSLFCVNFFGRTAEFETLQPAYYVIASPEYFQGEEKKEWAEDRMKTIQAIADKVTWPMKFLVPVLARRNKQWLAIIKSNPKIEVAYFNNVPIEGLMSLNHFFFKRNLGMPRPHNVLIPSILLAINQGFSKIYIAGADHSWLKEVFVTEKNEVLLSQKHFYDRQNANDTLDKNSPKPQPMHKGGSTEKRKLHEVLQKFYYSFRSYWQLRAYADSRNVKVHNLTKDSYIDAFEKVDPK